jgi:hypothetical protein
MRQQRACGSDIGTILLARHGVDNPAKLSGNATGRSAREAKVE